MWWWRLHLLSICAFYVDYLTSWYVLIFHLLWLRTLLLVQGRSADFAKHAIPAIRKQRILVTLTKSQPKKAALADGQRTSSNVGPFSSWGPPSARSPNHRLPPGQKHYPTVPSTCVLPAPPIHSQMPPPNGIPPLIVPPVAPPMPFPAPVSIPPGPPAWPAAHPRHPPPRLPVPGTGVFLPPGSSSTPPLQQLASSTVETGSLTEKENGCSTKSDHSTAASPGEKPEAKAERQECNGNMEGSESGKVAAEEEQQQQQQSGGI